MSNTITPTVFYRTLNFEGLEIFYSEAGPGFATATHAQQVNTLLTKHLP